MEIVLNLVSWNELATLFIHEFLASYQLTIYGHVLELLCLVIHIRWHSHTLHWCFVQPIKHPLNVIHSCLKQIHLITFRYFSILMLNKLHFINKPNSYHPSKTRTQFNQQEPMSHQKYQRYTTHISETLPTPLNLAWNIILLILKLPHWITKLVKSHVIFQAASP